MNDRTLLNALTDEGTVFNHDDVYSVKLDLLNWYRTAAAELKGKSKEEILKRTTRRLKLSIRTDLAGKDSKDEAIVKTVRSTRRYFVKTMPEMPPICVEFWEGSDPRWLKKALWYVYRSKDPATGLPFPLDLVDNLVSLPHGVAKEFAEEVEARLLRAGVDPVALLGIFSRFNPQKEE